MIFCLFCLFSAFRVSIYLAEFALYAFNDSFILETSLLFWLRTSSMLLIDLIKGKFLIFLMNNWRLLYSLLASIKSSNIFITDYLSWFKRWLIVYFYSSDCLIIDYFSSFDRLIELKISESRKILELYIFGTMPYDFLLLVSSFFYCWAIKERIFSELNLSPENLLSYVSILVISATKLSKSLKIESFDLIISLNSEIPSVFV